MCVCVHIDYATQQRETMQCISRGRMICAENLTVNDPKEPATVSSTKLHIFSGNVLAINQFPKIKKQMYTLQGNLRNQLNKSGTCAPL